MNRFLSKKFPFSKIVSLFPALSLRFIIDTLQVGGTEKHLSFILPELVKKGWKVKVITLSSLAPLKESLMSQGVAVKTPPAWFNAKFFSYFPFKSVILTFNVIRLCWEFVVDRRSITHFFLPRAYGIGMFAACLTGMKAPKLMSRRSLNYYQRKHWGFKNIESFFHQKCAYILGNSQAVIDQLNQDEKVALSKLKLLYNGIPLERYGQALSKNNVRASLNIAEDALVMILVANLIPYKGHADLLQALGCYRQRLPKSWKLLCVGKDEGLKESLQGLAKSLRIENNIYWLGSRNDTRDLLEASNIGLLCSHEEGFSNAILEAMAAGLPMIVTDAGGNREAVSHNDTGFVVEPKNPDQLGQAIYALANNPALAKSFGEAGRQRVEAFFSLEKCVQNYHDLYQSLLG